MGQIPFEQRKKEPTLAWFYLTLKDMNETMQTSLNELIAMSENDARWEEKMKLVETQQNNLAAFRSRYMYLMRPTDNFIVK